MQGYMFSFDASSRRNNEIEFFFIEMGVVCKMTKENGEKQGEKQKYFVPL